MSIGWQQAGYARSAGPGASMGRYPPRWHKCVRDRRNRMAADWALHLDMEVSRGTSPLNPATGQEELRKRILGGLAVRF